MLCPPVSVVLQEEEWESGLQFLPATDSRRLEKKPGCRKKLWIGLGLLLASAAVALLTGLLVWHFHRELPSNKPLFKTQMEQKPVDGLEPVSFRFIKIMLQNNGKTKCVKKNQGRPAVQHLQTEKQQTVVLKKPKMSNQYENSFY